MECLSTSMGRQEEEEKEEEEEEKWEKEKKKEEVVWTSLVGTESGANINPRHPYLLNRAREQRQARLQAEQLSYGLGAWNTPQNHRLRFHFFFKVG